MIKKSLLLICVVLLSLIVIAQANKIELSTIKQSFLVGENITFKVSLFDSANNPVNADVSVVIEDAEKLVVIERTVPSNKLVEVSLGENARSGYWKIVARYENVEASGLFMIQTNEQAKFSMDGDVLTVTNTGNTRYIKDIQIVIGDSIGVKSLDLDIGEKKSFRLIAPDGVYNIRITDGKTILTKSDVSLTGKAIGVLDTEAKTSSSGITGVLNPKDAEQTTSRSNLFVYVFLIIDTSNP